MSGITFIRTETEAKGTYVINTHKSELRMLDDSDLNANRDRIIFVIKSSYAEVLKTVPICMKPF